MLMFDFCVLCASAPENTEEFNGKLLTSELEDKFLKRVLNKKVNIVTNKGFSINGAILVGYDDKCLIIERDPPPYSGEYRFLLVRKDCITYIVQIH